MANMPGFTAGEALSPRTRQYLNRTARSSRTHSIVPQGDTACQLACTAAYDLACGACVGLTGPAAPVCYAAATAAYATCLRACV